jgi:hypothetical protein
MFTIMFRIETYANQVNKQADRMILLVPCLAYSCTLKKPRVRFPETSVNLYQITRRHIADGSNIPHNLLKWIYSYIFPNLFNFNLYNLNFIFTWKLQ